MSNDTGGKDLNRQFNFKINDKELEEFQEKTGSSAASLRNMIRMRNKAEDDFDFQDDIQMINVTMLKAYQNLLEKHKSYIQNEIDKVKENLEEFQEIKEDDEEDNVLLTMELDLEKEFL
jgi:hypothetical protein